MALNDLIASGGVQNVQPPNLLQQYAAMQAIQHAQGQNALAQYQLSSAQRQDAEANALRSALPADFDINNPGHVNALLKAAPSVAPAFLERVAKVGHERASAANLAATTAKTGVDMVGERLKQARLALEGVNTPEGYLAWNQANHNDPVLKDYFAQRGITADATAARIQAAMQTPGGFEQLLNESKLGAEKALENHFMEQGSGQQKWVSTVPKYGMGTVPAQIIPGTIVNQVADPNAVLSAKTSLATNAATVAATEAGHASTAQTAANLLAFQSDPKKQAEIAGAKAEAQKTAEAKVAITTQANQERVGAQKVLKALNYDPATGTDDISKLIPGSTSGMIQRTGALVKGELTGTGTSGAEAIAKLGTMANKMALDIAGGKLGAGISNTDRDFISASLGDVANPNLNANVRYAAWQAARQRIMQLANGGGSAPITTAPAGVDSKNPLLK